LEERLEVAREVAVIDDVALVGEDADVHGTGVQVDAAVESVCVVSKKRIRASRFGWGPDRGSWREVHSP
jgi:hypothetical protein